MTTTLTTVNTTSIQPVIDLVTNAVTSTHTRRAYTRSLTDFMAWYQQTGQTGFTKATVQAHITALRTAGVSASSINQRLTAIRKLAAELADNGVIDHSAAQAISRAEGVRSEGKRLGNWLTRTGPAPLRIAGRGNGQRLARSGNSGRSVGLWAAPRGVRRVDG